MFFFEKNFLALNFAKKNNLALDATKKNSGFELYKNKFPCSGFFFNNVCLYQKKIIWLRYCEKKIVRHVAAREKIISRRFLSK